MVAIILSVSLERGISDIANYAGRKENPCNTFDISKSRCIQIGKMQNNLAK
jgi:hypothetical protein